MSRAPKRRAKRRPRQLTHDANGNGWTRRVLWGVSAGIIGMFLTVGGALGMFALSRGIDKVEKQTDKDTEHDLALTVKNAEVRAIEGRLSRIEGWMEKIDGKVESLQDGIRIVNERLGSVSGRVDLMVSTTSRHASEDAEVNAKLVRAILDNELLLRKMGIEPTNDSRIARERPLGEEREK